jgi:hypothetical protein
MYHVRVSSEPVIYIETPQGTLHIFNYDMISSYYNTSIDVCEVREIFEARKGYTFKNDARFIQSTNDEPDLDVRYLNTLQTINALKLYTLCDHALEHLYLNGDDPKLRNLDLNHTKFGKTNKFLSGLITQQPSNENNCLVKRERAKYFDQIYTPIDVDENSNDDDDDDDDEEEEEVVESSDDE